MAKTKRTVKEAKAATASSDSKLITQSKLNRFATGLWDKIKRRYDGTFKAARLTESDSTDKKLIFTKTDDIEVEINLKDYARLQDRNAFKQDVSVDDAETKNNLSIGTKTGTVDPSQRSLGARNLSSGLFTDGYVSKFRVYLDSASQQSEVAVHVWAIKKGTTKSADTTARDKMHNGKRIAVSGSNSNNKKWIDIPIDATFEHDTYFIFRTGSPVNVEAISSIATANTEDVVNLNVYTPQDVADQTLDFSDERTDKTAYVEIFGRIGIVDLNKKIEKVSADSSLYVKHSETTDIGGSNQYAGKVVKLDGSGKLNKDMLPSIAINEYFEIEQFTHEKLDAIKDRFENGDVVVVTGEGVNKGKRFLCVNKQDNLGNLIEGFVELNSKDGIVKSVNGKIGEVNLELEATADKLKLKIKSGSETTNIVETAVDIITDDDIVSIIDGLTD